MKPQNIALIGTEVAIIWNDGAEHYYPMETLRLASPSAENLGETDLFGRIMGGDPRREYPGVTVTSFDHVGSYAVRFTFSDGHNTGLFSHQYLRQIGEALERGDAFDPKA
jgi:DUF971 family protein